MRSRFDKVRRACPLPTGQSTLTFLLHGFLLPGTPCFRSLPRPFFCILLLPIDEAVESIPHGRRQLTRVNSTNVLDEGLRIGEIGRRMNSKVKSVKQGAYRK
jgi:hypothetical protein